jgi:hypothetical protein
MDMSNERMMALAVAIQDAFTAYRAAENTKARLDTRDRTLENTSTTLSMEIRLRDHWRIAVDQSLVGLKAQRELIKLAKHV